MTDGIRIILGLVAFAILAAVLGFGNLSGLALSLAYLVGLLMLIGLAAFIALSLINK